MLSWTLWRKVRLFFPFKRKAQIHDRSHITLFRCNHVCSWRDVIGKFYNKNGNFEMKVLFGSCLYLFCDCFVAGCLLENCFDSETFGMACPVVPQWGLSHSGTCKFVSE